MKVVVTGGNGMLGRTLRNEFTGWEVFSADLPDVDITVPETVERFLRETTPDAVIHCAAMTAVDKCESEKLTAFRINRDGSANVAAACRKLNIRLIAISTDYVFDGDAPQPYRESDIATGGRTVYGQSKFAGEQEIRKIAPDHVICRIAWLYGAGGPSFVHTMLNLADGSRPELKVVADQIGNPTSTLAVARKLREILLMPELRGTFHLTCEGEASWADFAVEIFRLAGKKQLVTPCTTDEFPRPAPRPKNSRLDNLRLAQAGLSPMPHWQEALAEFISTEFK